MVARTQSPQNSQILVRICAPILLMLVKMCPDSVRRKFGDKARKIIKNRSFELFPEANRRRSRLTKCSKILRDASSYFLLLSPSAWVKGEKTMTTTASKYSQIEIDVTSRLVTFRARINLNWLLAVVISAIKLYAYLQALPH